MRNRRHGILEMTTGADGRSVTTRTIPSSSRKARAYAELRRLKHRAPPNVRYRMLEDKLSTREYPFPPYSTPGGK